MRPSVPLPESIAPAKPSVADVANSLPGAKKIRPPTVFSSDSIPLFRSDRRHHVLVTGGSGFIGSDLCKRLLFVGHQVTVLSRRPHAASRLLGFQAESIRFLGSFQPANPVTAIFNLAGAPIVGMPWTKSRRAVLKASRISVTVSLAEWARRQPVPPEVWIQASAVGFYGSHPDSTILTEADKGGSGFGAELCRQWERAAIKSMTGTSTRLVICRLGIVMGYGGGLLDKMILPHKFGLGARLGNGRQMISWIHNLDLMRLFSLALSEPSMSGPVNACTPEPVSQQKLNQSLAKHLHRPTFLAVPESLIRFAAGDMAEMLVSGQNVIPKRLMTAKFKFRYPDIDSALIQILAAY